MDPYFTTKIGLVRTNTFCSVHFIKAENICFIKLLYSVAIKLKTKLLKLISPVKRTRKSLHFDFDWFKKRFSWTK